MDAPIIAQNVSHWFGRGELRNQVLFDITATIGAGEIVILTGPSGSGKTTLLTLIGALRSVQNGSLHVLGKELRGAGEGRLVEVRRHIGYVFQAHNLLEALTARQNVETSLSLHPELSRAERERRSLEMLETVGLGQRVEHHPSQLSGGERQRVAIARALVGQPEIVLADEPTGSLDSESGREVAELMQELAKKRGTTVLLVTHDNRILDIADRILALEDGRLASFMHSVTTSTEHMMSTLAQDIRKGELVRRVRDMPPCPTCGPCCTCGHSSEEFVGLLDQVSGEVQRFLDVVEVSQSDAFESMLEQVFEVFTAKVGEILEADRATLYLADEQTGELWSRVAGPRGGGTRSIRFPIGEGIAGHVAATGRTMNVLDAHAEARFDKSADEESGYRTRSVLSVPIADARGQVFAVAELVNKRGGEPFDDGDEQRVRELTSSLAVLHRLGSVCECGPSPGVPRSRQQAAATECSPAEPCGACDSCTPTEPAERS
jgi:putative ABC transport system ATP-binding protein